MLRAFQKRIGGLMYSDMYRNNGGTGVYRSQTVEFAAHQTGDRGISIVATGTHGARAARMAPQSPAPNRIEGVVLLDDNYSIVGHDQGAELILRNGAEPASSKLHIPNEVSHALRIASDAPAGSAHMRVYIGELVYHCCVHVALLDPQSRIRRVLIVHFSRDVSMDEALVKISAEYRLTVREQQALHGIVLGLSSKEVAQQMNISPNTVKAFLRLIMGKMGVSSRSAIMAKLFEPNAH